MNNFRGVSKLTRIKVRTQESRMEILRSVIGGSETVSQVSSAETIERLVDRVNTSTLIDDRRDACRALRAMSKKFRQVAELF